MYYNSRIHNLYTNFLPLRSITTLTQFGVTSVLLIVKLRTEGDDDSCTSTNDGDITMFTSAGWIDLFNFLLKKCISRGKYIQSLSLIVTVVLLALPSGRKSLDRGIRLQSKGEGGKTVKRDA